jgi:hypothetical protein
MRAAEVSARKAQLTAPDGLVPSFSLMVGCRAYPGGDLR